MTNSTRAVLGIYFCTLCLAGCNDVSSVSTPPAGPTALTITTTSLPNGTVGQAYNATVQGTGGTPPYSWLVTPSLPSGLSLNPTTGAITGTPGPTTVGTTSYTFVLQDAASTSTTKVLTLTINPAPVPPTITTTALQNGTVNQPYCPFTLTATGGTPPYTWSVTPALPNGLQFNVISPGTISGTPLAGTGGKTTSHTFTVQDSAVPINQTNSKSLPLTITATVPALSITTNTLPNGKVGQAYSATLQSSGGIPCYTWSVTPALPSGLQLNASTGAITGTPAAGTAGVYSRTYTVRDSAVPTNQTASKMLSFTITP